MIETVLIVNILCLVPLLPTMPPWLAIFLHQVSSAPHVDGRGQVVDSTCAALLPSTSQFQVLRAMADEGMDDGIWRMNKDHHVFFCRKASLTILPHHWLFSFLLPCMPQTLWRNDPIWLNLTRIVVNVWLSLRYGQLQAPRSIEHAVPWNWES